MSQTLAEFDNLHEENDRQHLFELLNERGLDWILESLEDECHNKQFDEPHLEHRWRQKSIVLMEAKHKLYGVNTIEQTNLNHHKWVYIKDVESFEMFKCHCGEVKYESIEE